VNTPQNDLLNSVMSNQNVTLWQNKMFDSVSFCAINMP